MRITRVTLLLIAGIITLGFYQLARHFLAEVEPQTFQATEEVMVDTAHLLAELVNAQEPGDPPKATAALKDAFTRAHSHHFSAKIFDHLKEQVGLHAYLTDSNGIVIFDSDHDRRVGQNLRVMRDVALTLAGHYGARSSRDHPNDASSSILYVAAPVGDPKHPSGVLTVYKPQRDVLPLIQARRRIIYSACGLIGLGILFLIATVFLWLFRPIGRITAYARAIEHGERPPKPRIGLGREVNTLANALDSMRRALDGRSYVHNYVQTLTHEMKSPLAAIRGAAELLQEEQMPAATRERFLNNILAETARSELLINRLLELSALEHRAHLEEPQLIDFRDVLNRALQQIQPMGEIPKINWIVAAHSTPLMIRGEAFLLRAAILNLLENAVDFSPPGGRIEVTVSNSPGPDLTLAIRDWGPGIPDYARDKVFERFYSLRHHAAGRKGTGLGLTLAAEVAKLHGGTLTLTPAEGGGTIATLTIPMA